MLPFLNLSVMVILSTLAADRAIGADTDDPLQDFSERWSVKRLIEVHHHRRPLMQVQDVYRMLYQVHLAPGDPPDDRSALLSGVMPEWAAVEGDTVATPLVERISTSGNVVRVNLAPARRLNRGVVQLVEAMQRTAELRVPDTLMFLREWNEFSALVRFGLLDFPASDVLKWDQRIGARVLEPAEHSEKYLRAYRPGYRVVFRSTIEGFAGREKGAP